MTRLLAYEHEEQGPPVSAEIKFRASLANSFQNFQRQLLVVLKLKLKVGEKEGTKTMTQTICCAFNLFNVPLKIFSSVLKVFSILHHEIVVSIEPILPC